jgi:chromosome segregation ATPase
MAKTSKASGTPRTMPKNRVAAQVNGRPKARRSAADVENERLTQEVYRLATEKAALDHIVRDQRKKLSDAEVLISDLGRQVADWKKGDEETSRTIRSLRERERQLATRLEQEQKDSKTITDAYNRAEAEAQQARQLKTQIARLEREAQARASGIEIQTMEYEASGGISVVRVPVGSRLVVLCPTGCDTE